MKYIYLMINGSEWEDIVVFLTQEEAIEASLAHQKTRIEIFGKEDNRNGYVPTYTYYKNGMIFTSF